MSTYHPQIQEKLSNFIAHKKVPHLLFYGVSGSGKKTLVNWFIQTLYRDKEIINEYVMYVNCGHCKGIQFVREELKFFSKTNININRNGGNFFKSVVLLNADKLTIDAQSAMRRCIEIFSHNTRFFIVVDDKCKILKPILSRLCEIYLPPPPPQSLPKYEHIDEVDPLPPNCLTVLPKQTQPYSRSIQIKNKRTSQLRRIFQNIDKRLPSFTMFNLAKDLYEQAYSGIDLMFFLEKEYEPLGISMDGMVEMLFTFNKIKREIKNEPMFMFIILYTIFYDSSSCSKFIQAAT
jgi:hypothetical protein